MHWETWQNLKHSGARDADQTCVEVFIPRTTMQQATMETESLGRGAQVRDACQDTSNISGTAASALDLSTVPVDVLFEVR